MSIRTTNRPSETAHRRLQRRIRHRELWSEEELEQLDTLYRQRPKLWWHVRRVVRQQVQLTHRAHRLGVAHLITPPILDEVALDAEPGRLVDDLTVALRSCRAGRPERPWTSLMGVLCALLRREALSDVEEVEPPPVGLDSAFTPLSRRVDLQSEGRQMQSCIGRRSWWRETVSGRGFGYAVRRGDARATVWITDTEPEGGVQVSDALGPLNRSLDPEFRRWIDEAVSAAVDGMAALRPAGVSGAECAADRVPSYWARLDAMERIGDRLGPRVRLPSPPMRRDHPPDPRPLAGLPPVHWVTWYDMFAEPPAWDVPEPVRGRRALAPATMRWDEVRQVVVYDTPNGAWVLHPGLPLRLEAPASGLHHAPFLWMDVRNDGIGGEVPEAARHAQKCFVDALPAPIRQACTTVEELRGMPGIWLLGQIPALAPFFQKHPALAAPVRGRACSPHAQLQRLRDAARQPEPAARLDGVLTWLGVGQCDRLRPVVARLHEEGWSTRALHALDRLLAAGPAVDRHLARMRRILPSQVLLLDAAARAGLLAQITSSLLAEVEEGEPHAICADAMEVVFADLAIASEQTGVALPRLRSIRQLSTLLAERRPRPVAGFSFLALDGPWGTPARSLDEVESLAADLGHDRQIWRTAAASGFLVYAGVPLDIPTVTWMRPAGLRGRLYLAGAYSLQGRPAPRAVVERLEQAIDAHDRRVANLPAGWSAAEAVQHNLPAGLAAVLGSGHFGTGELIRHLFALRG